MFLTAEYLAIAMEYAAGGDMYHRVVRCRGLPEDDARWYFQQLVIAIRLLPPHGAPLCCTCRAPPSRVRCLQPLHSAHLLDALCVMDGNDGRQVASSL